MQRTSDFLVELIESKQEALSVHELLKAFGTRAFGLVFLLFGLPNILPLPGLPILCGLILLFVGAQLFLGLNAPWLPQRLLAIKIDRAKLALIIHKAIPYIWKVERLSKMRFGLFTTDYSKRIIGLVVVALAISLIVIPIPWVGSMPQGLAIVFLGLGMVEQDGLIVCVGAILAFIAAIIVTSIAYALWFGASLLL